MEWVYEVFTPFCKVKFCVENVSSMDESARREISAALQVMPIKLDPSDCMPFMQSAAVCLDISGSTSDGGSDPANRE